jgi:ferritin
MTKNLLQLIEESIKLELNVAEIYMFFYNTFPEDSDFWREMALEEEGHANLIKSGRDTFLDQFPPKLLAPSLQELYKTNNKLTSLLKEYKENPPSRETAFNIAMDIEQLPGEQHFQLAMEKSLTSSIMKTFQELNNDKKDHFNRIRAYMSDKGIEIRRHFSKPRISPS